MPKADKRVTPMTLDVTSVSQIERAAREVETLDILINNAGVAIYDDLTNLDAIAVNLFGAFNVTRAFLPLLTRSKGASSTTCPWPRSPPCRSYRPTPFRRRPRST